MEQTDSDIAGFEGLGLFGHDQMELHADSLNVDLDVSKLFTGQHATADCEMFWQPPPTQALCTFLARAQLWVQETDAVLQKNVVAANLRFSSLKRRIEKLRKQCGGLGNGKETAGTIRIPDSPLDQVKEGWNPHKKDL